MYLCSDCKERERSWSYIGSSGHCDVRRCENYFYEPVEFKIEQIITIPVALCLGSKNYKKLIQPKITKFLKKL